MKTLLLLMCSRLLQGPKKSDTEKKHPETDERKWEHLQDSSCCLFTTDIQCNSKQGHGQLQDTGVTTVHGNGTWCKRMRNVHRCQVKQQKKNYPYPNTEVVQASRLFHGMLPILILIKHIQGRMCIALCHFPHILI